MRSAKTEAERESLREEIFEAKQLMAPASTQDNEYFRRITSEPLSLNALQSMLQEDEMILEYVLNDPNSYCLAIARHRIAAHRLPCRSEIDSLVDQFLFEIRNKENGNEIRRKLFTTLVGKIEGLDKARRLHVIPDHSLYLLPFESLIDQKEKTVLESHTVSYVQSATVLHLLRTLPLAKNNQSKMLLALGDAIYKLNRKTALPQDSFPIGGFNLPRTARHSERGLIPWSIVRRERNCTDREGSD
jgi:CHAT domain-containing protein